MATRVKVGTVAVGTVNGSTATVDLSDVFDAGEPCRLLVLQTVKENTEGRFDGNFARSQGFVTRDGGAIQQAYISSFSADAGTASDAARGVNNTAALKTYSAATPTVDAEIDVTSFDEDSFVLTATDAFTATTLVHYIAIGGSGWTKARCGIFVCDLSSTGTQNIPLGTGWGNPTQALFATAGSSITGDQAGAARMAFGVAAAANVGRASAFVESDGAATMTCARWKDNNALGIPASNNILDGSFDLNETQATDALTIDWAVAATTAYRVAYCAIVTTEDVTIEVGAGAAPTAAAPQVQSITHTGVPKGALVWSTMTAGADGISDTVADLGGFGLGASDGVNETFAGACQKDGSATASTGRWQSTSKGVMLCVPVASGTNPPALTSEADVTFDGADVDFTWTTTDGGRATEYSYLIVGEVAAGVTGQAAQTLPAFTQDAAGAAAVDGASASDLPALTQDVAGTATVTGGSAQTLPALEQDAEGALTVTGGAAVTLPALTQDATAAASVAGNADGQLPALEQSAAGAATVTGEAGAALPAFAQDAAGTVEIQGIAGGISQDLPALEQDATGDLLADGVAAQLLPALHQAVDANATVSGSAAGTFASLVAVAEGALRAAGHGMVTLPALDQAMFGLLPGHVVATETRGGSTGLIATAGTGYVEPVDDGHIAGHAPAGHIAT